MKGSKMKNCSNPDLSNRFNLYLLPLRLRMKYPEVFSQNISCGFSAYTIPLRIRERLKIAKNFKALLTKEIPL